MGKKTERLIPYEFLPSQDWFHFSDARFKALCGPVGTGKTQALCQEAVRMTVENPGCTGLLGAPTYPMLRDTTLAQFLEVCRLAKMPHQWQPAQQRVRMLETDATVLFRPLDNYERLRGPNLAWFGVDELTYTQPEAWERLEARLRDPRAKLLHGFAVFTPKGYDWVYRKFKAAPVEGYELIEAAPFENRYVLDKVPDYYERLRRSYDPRFYEQEALGKFLNVTQGRVYYAFDRRTHVRPLRYEPGLPLLWAWDFNISPMSSVICQQRGGEVSVLDEIVLRTSSTPEVCQEFMQRWGDHAAGLVIFGDASGSARHSSTGESDFNIIREFFREHRRLKPVVRVPRRNPPVRDRVNAVNGKLCNAAGDREMFVDPRCRELIADLEQVSYKPDSSVIDKDSDRARTHTSDALGYYVWQTFRPAARIGERGQRLF